MLRRRGGAGRSTPLVRSEPFTSHTPHCVAVGAVDKQGRLVAQRDAAQRCGSGMRRSPAWVLQSQLEIARRMSGGHRAAVCEAAATAQQLDQAGVTIVCSRPVKAQERDRSAERSRRPAAQIAAHRRSVRPPLPGPRRHRTLAQVDDRIANEVRTERGHRAVT